MTDVDADLFLRLLRKVEGLAHIRGWDQLPTLYVIYDTAAAQTAEMYDRLMARNPALGPPTVLRGYAAQPMLAGSWFTGVQVAEAVTGFATNVAYSDLDEGKRMAEILSAPGVCGFAFLGEGYSTNRREVMVRAVFEGVHVGSEPDSEEARMVYAHDVADRPYRVVRHRGRPAEAFTSGDWRGDFSTSVALLCDVVRGTVPPPEEFHARYPGIRESILGGQP